MIRLKNALILVGAVLAVTALFFYQTQKTVGGVFTEMQKDQVRGAGQMAMSAVKHHLQVSKQEVISLIRSEVALKWLESPKTKLALSDDLKTSSFLGLVYVEQTGGSWSPRWLSLQKNLVDQWSEYLISKTYQSVAFSKIEKGNIQFVKTMNHQDRPVWLMAFQLDLKDASDVSGKAKPGYVVAILSNEALADLGSGLRSFNSEFILMDPKGYAISHSTTGYISASFSDYPLLKSRKGKSLEKLHTDTFYQGDSEYWGVSQKVPFTNLQLVLSRKIKSVSVAPVIFETKWLIALAAILLLFLSGTMLVRNVYEEKFRLLATVVSNFANGVVEIQPQWRKILPNSMADMEKILTVPFVRPSAGLVREQELSSAPVETEEFEPAGEPSVAASNLPLPDSSGEEELFQGTTIQPVSPLVAEEQRLEQGGDILTRPVDESIEENINSQLSMVAPPLNVVSDEAPLFADTENAISENQPLSSDGDEDDEHDDINLDEEAFQAELPEGRFWVQKAVAEALAKYKDQMKSMGVKIHMSNQSKDLLSVEGNEKEFFASLCHVLQNSIEALESVENKVIGVKIQNYADEVKIDIKDYGDGIAEEVTPEQMFSPFYTTKDSQSNPGMGLTVVKQNVEDMGGYVSAQNSLGIGFEVSIVLPLAGKTVAESDIPRNKVTAEDLFAEPPVAEGAPLFAGDEEDSDEDDHFQMVSPSELGGMKPLADAGDVPAPPPLTPPQNISEGLKASKEIIAEEIGDPMSEADFFKAQLNASLPNPVAKPGSVGPEVLDTPSEDDGNAEERTAEEQAKDLLDELVSMQVQVRKPKVK